MGQSLLDWSRNMEALQKLMASSPSPGQPASRIWEQAAALGLSPPPLPREDMERFYREWLALFGAVPKKDYEALAQKLEALAAETERLRRALEALTRGKADLQEVSGMIKPWVELAEKTLRAQRTWLEEWNKGPASHSGEPTTGKE